MRLIKPLPHPQKDRDSVIEYVRDRAINDKRYWVNYEKIAGLGWAPKTSFEEGLKRTIEWYKNNSDHWGDVSAVLVPHPTAPNAPRE